ncbi:MAG: hypothetical protein COA95_10150 [Methylophaga sp.]|nr:MAG: hypothetical protein COA95_10150 [Methylophaga sp.]
MLTINNNSDKKTINESVIKNEGREIKQLPVSSGMNIFNLYVYVTRLSSVARTENYSRTHFRIIYKEQTE